MIRAVVIIAMLAGAATGAVLYMRGHDESITDSVPTTIVGQEKLVRKVRAEGNLRAVKATPISVPRTAGEWGGMKIAWLAPDGGKVKKGDVLVRFDPTAPEKQLRDGEADLASANARLRAEQIKGKTKIEGRDAAAALAVQELDKTRQFQAKDQQIFSRNQIIESQIDEKLASARKDHADGTKEIERNLSRSNAGLIAVEKQRAQLAITHAKTALDSMEIRAPHDGLFILQRNWRGELPKTGDQLWPGQKVAEIPLLETMEAEVFVLEVDASGLAENQAVDVTIEARPGEVHHGKVRLVDKLAKPRNDGTPVQYFEVVVALDKTDPTAMKPGQRVVATILLDEQTALIVPRQAISNKDGKNFVFRKTARGDFEQVPVELGAATSGRVVVKTGLAAGDRIALRDPTRTLDQTLGSGDPANATPAPTGGGGAGGGEGPGG
ncbi:MAG: efflux RND transporter periplasmic adaptor subunit [Kofleriaceae bacterium]